VRGPRRLSPIASSRDSSELSRFLGQPPGLLHFGRLGLGVVNGGTDLQQWIATVQGRTASGRVGPWVHAASCVGVCFTAMPSAPFLFDPTGELAPPVCDALEIDGPED
jgi:hypothetical protein